MGGKESMENVEKTAENADYLEKQKRIKREVNRLKKIFKDIELNKKNLVISTIHDIAFMNITMEDLRESILVNGTTIEYQNGKDQWGEKQSPDAQLYLQLSQKSTQAMKILLDCLPKTQPKTGADEDGFDEFVWGRDEE